MVHFIIALAPSVFSYLCLLKKLTLESSSTLLAFTFPDSQPQRISLRRLCRVNAILRTNSCVWNFRRGDLGRGRRNGLGMPKTSLVCKFPCVLDPSPSNLEWPASFISLHPTCAGAGLQTNSQSVAFHGSCSKLRPGLQRHSPLLLTTQCPMGKDQPFLASCKRDWRPPETPQLKGGESEVLKQGL